MQILSRKNKVTLQWIPSHSGYQGNETADELANKGRDEPPDTGSNYPNPHTYYTNKINDHFNNNLKKQWEGPIISKESKLFVGKLLESIDHDQHKLSKALLNCSTTDISTLIKVLSGHNCLNHHLFRAHLSPTEICCYCVPEKLHYVVEEPLETTQHILCECPAFSKERNEIYESHTITEEEVFSNSIATNFQKILKFFRKIEVLNRSPKYTKMDLSPIKRARKYTAKNTKRQRIN